MELWASNKKSRLKKIVLGSIPTGPVLEKTLKKSLPSVIHRLLAETQEDLDEIKRVYQSLGVEVLQYPVESVCDALMPRNGFIVIDDHMYITARLENQEPLYDSVDKKTFVEHQGIEDEPNYCPNIMIHDDYVILDRLDPEGYKWWRQRLQSKRKIITAFNEGHSDGVYCNIGDKIWLTNGDALPYKKYWPNIPTMELSTTNGGLVNQWKGYEDYYAKRELEKTQGRYLVMRHEMTKQDLNFIDDYLSNWVGYCDETLFDINMSVIDENNVMAISQNSLVYDRLESLGIKVHKVPFRHRFFWDGGLHCITNDLVREK
jgi:hypothetical protein